MRSALAYAPGRGPLGEVHPLAACLHLGGLALVAFAFSNPIVLAGAGVAACLAGLLAGARRALAAALRWSAALALLMLIVNVIVSQRGDTILVRGWELPVLGRIDVSAEALAEGGVLALRIAVVFAVFAVFSAAVDPDRLLRGVRPFARHSALTATLVTRLVPLAAADQARFAEAARLRGPAAAPAGRAAIARRLVAASLDRAVDVAAALELRGYARGAPARGTTARHSRHSWRFACGGLATTAAALTALAAGAGSFEAYPLVLVDSGAATLALTAALPALAAAPYVGLRGTRRRHG